MFLPNSHSFLFVRSGIKKPVVQSGVQESAASLPPHHNAVWCGGLPPSSSSDFGRKVFLPNTHSFLLVRSAIKKPVIQSDIHPVRDRPAEGAATPIPSVGATGQATAVGRSVSNGIQESAASLPPHLYIGSGGLPSSPSSDFDKPPIGDKSPHLFSSPNGKCTGKVGDEKNRCGDKDKRTFLKVAGIAGAGLAASLLLPKKAEALIMGSSPTTGVVGVKNATNTRINPATEETLGTVLKKTDLTFDAGSVAVKVTSLPPSSFSDSGSVAKSGLVDADRHVQVDVLSSALPTTASTETTLQTISFGGFKFIIRLDTVGSIDYVGEANIGTLTSAASWRIKRVDSTTGIVIQWAGTGVFNQIWDNRASLSYS